MTWRQSQLGFEICRRQQGFYERMHHFYYFYFPNARCHVQFVLNASELPFICGTSIGDLWSA